jgi:hypothetical protein
MCLPAPVPQVQVRHSAGQGTQSKEQKKQDNRNYAYDKHVGLAETGRELSKGVRKPVKILTLWEY